MKKFLLRFALLTASLTVAFLSSQLGMAWYWRHAARTIASPDPGSPSPLPTGPDTVFVEEMTWIEVRDAMKAGKRTIIIPTGGVEQNGPFLVMGKHNLVCRATAEAVARKLGDALVAPTVAFVPQGGTEPPTDHMKYAGTISLTDDTYRRLLIDIGASFRTHGFDHVVFVADSTGNLDGQRLAVAELNARWSDRRTRFYDITEFYHSYDDAKAWLVEQGLREFPDFHHDEFAISAILMAIDPKAVRMEQRMKSGLFAINKIDLSPPERTVEWGRKIIGFRADKTVAAIRKARAQQD